MDNPLESTLAELTDIQRRAVNWDEGPLLVLAGPGSGKTRVLTCRIARLLDSARDQRFRILALTFTNKAAHEMATRVTALVPGLEGRAHIDTFHGFCAQVLRQHGVHLGIKPDFTIYSRTEDRQAVLEEALRRGCGDDWSSEDLRLLGTGSDARSGVTRNHSRSQGPGVRYGFSDRARGRSLALLAQHQERRRQRRTRRRATRVLRRGHPHETPPDPVPSAAIPGMDKAAITVSGRDGLLPDRYEIGERNASHWKGMSGAGCNSPSRRC